MGSPYSGRLELTWTNKDMRLLAQEDGRYEWVPATDYRVAEKRLLHNVTTVGGVGPDANRASDNLLIRGDALHGLTSLLDLPEFARTYAGKVRLCYIDPPFNTGQAFEHYDDALEHSVWLTMMRDRLLQIRRLLAPNGSVWLHCDDAEVHRARCVLDELFGPANFVATVIWQKADTPRMDARKFSSSHDYLLCYSRLPDWQPKKLVFEPDLAGYPYTDTEGRRYSSLTLRKWGHNSRRSDRPKLWYPLEHEGRSYWPTKPDGTEGYWRWERAKYEANRNRIEWADKGHGLQPYVVTHAPDQSERPFETWWPNTDVGHNREAKSHLKTMFPNEPFDTPKPERLLHRVVEISTEPGDLVLDCFLGSGTTAAVAHKMNRRWLGIEWSANTLATYTVPRLTKVVHGEDLGGITATVEWKGGGGFRVIDVAPSMFEDDEGRVVLADWATNGALGEATAAQLGFEYVDESPFCGRKGRTRLAVVDGLVGEEVVRVLMGALAAEERAVVCGTAIDPAARSVLKELRPGSTMRKIPSSILEEYRQQRRARSQLAQVLDWADALELVEPGSETEPAGTT